MGTSKSTPPIQARDLSAVIRASTAITVSYNNENEKWELEIWSPCPEYGDGAVKRDHLEQYNDRATALTRKRALHPR